eukprot:1159381-Pelagomonas_calceolata.AAC.2
MLVVEHTYLKVSEKHAVQLYWAAQQRMKKSVREHMLAYACMVYDIAAGMYVWGTEFYKKAASSKPFADLCSLRRFLGVESTATNWPVLRECGQKPLQFYWFRATVKFFNSMHESNSETLRQALKADLHLADRDESCWSARVSKPLSGMRNVDTYTVFIARN